MKNLMTIKEASIWATNYLQKNITPSNISYLIQYGRIAKTTDNNGVFVDSVDLTEYYKQHHESKEKQWKRALGDDLNWHLSFSEYTESETTKHVHRIHPYKGKFIPQLVEYFLDSHTDEFKQTACFQKGDIVLDPFCGSGTTLVQANELGINAVGIDVSAFNALISNVKIGAFNIEEPTKISLDISSNLKKSQDKKNNHAFESELLNELKIFNHQFFPAIDFKRKVRLGEVNEKEYGAKKAAEFSKIYENMVGKYGIVLKQSKSDGFIDKWFLQVVRDEIDFVFEQIKTVKNQRTKKLLSMILSRTMRSCRATTHADLGTLREPVISTYYCKKHGKICKPLFSISSWWSRYSQDTIKRVAQFDSLRTNTLQRCLIGDSRKIDLIGELKARSPDLAQLVKNKKIDGVFSSPPYVGLINYHEQHAYAYSLFGFDRKDELEIGPLFNGQGLQAQKSYVEGVASVLNNTKRYLKPDYDVFLVANDKHKLYPKIAASANMKIVNEHKRPVLNRVEKDRSAYAEIIFHLKEND